MAKRANSGALFRNTNKTKDKQPDYTGTSRIACPCCNNETEYKLAAWINEKDGKKYMSIAYKVKGVSAIKTTATVQAQLNENVNENDDAPF